MHAIAAPTDPARVGMTRGSTNASGEPSMRFLCATEAAELLALRIGKPMPRLESMIPTPSTSPAEPPSK